MKTRFKLIIIGVVIVASLFVMNIFMPPTAWLIHPCQLGFTAPEANALIAHQTIGEIFNRSDVIAVGKITESFPWCFPGGSIVTYMTLEVDEYLKNPLDVDTIRLQARGGNIGGFGVWVEDKKIFDSGENVLLFLDGPIKDNTYQINPYSISITTTTPGMDLIKGIELRADEHRITLSKGESGNIILLLDSFFGYDKMTPLSVPGFVFYDLETGDDTLYEDPLELEQFGIRIESTTITPIVNGTVSFDLPITIDANAKEGKYFVSLVAQTGGQMGSIQYAPWKNSHKQIQITVENEN